MNAFRVSVASSALWLSGCWTLTKTQSSKLGSWSARLLCRMVSCRRRPDESLVDHWRRRHRTGHTLAEQFGLDLPQLCLLQKHRFAGHVATRKPDSLVHRTLTTRDLAWWRHTQVAHARLKDKWRGVHSERFNVWRWEAPLESFYGRAFQERHAEATSVGLATECSGSQSVEKRRKDVRCDAWVGAVFHSSLSCVHPQLWARAQFVALCCRLLAVQISGICSWGPWSWHGFRLPPSWVGYEHGAVSLLYMRAFSCSSLGNGSVVTRRRSS